MKSLLTLTSLALGLLLGLAGCERPEQVLPPPNLLSKQQVISLLVRFHLLEARAESSRLPPDSARALFLSQQRAILWNQHVSAEDSTFERSYRYYAVHNKDLDEIYAAVIDSLTARQYQLGGQSTPTHH